MIKQEKMTFLRLCQTAIQKDTLILNITIGAVLVPKSHTMAAWHVGLGLYGSA